MRPGLTIGLFLLSAVDVADASLTVRAAAASASGPSDTIHKGTTMKPVLPDFPDEGRFRAQFLSDGGQMHPCCAGKELMNVR